MSVRLRPVPSLRRAPAPFPAFPTFGAALAAALGAASVTGQSAPVRLDPVGDIGCALCEGPGAFGSIMDVALGQGRVVVADRDAPHLRIFALDGASVGVAGPEGDGPGEVRLPMAVSVTDGGLAVVDMRGSRVLLLDPEGRERRRQPLERFPLAAAFGSGTEALDLTLTDFRSMEASIVRWHPEVGFRTLRDGVEELGLKPPGEMPLLFSLARTAEGRFAVGIGVDDYRLLFFDADGRRAREVVRDVPRRPKTDEETRQERAGRQAARDRMAAAEGGSAGAVEIDPLRLHFGLHALRFDGDGRLWVRTDRARSGTAFDLFDVRGEYLGAVHVPERVDAFAVADGFLAAEVLDALDVATVRVWRVAPVAP